MTRLRTSESGMTLVELIITVSIIGVISSIAIPTIYTSWLPKFRLKSAVSSLAGRIQMARIKAISTRKNCVVLFSGNGHTLFIEETPYNNVLNEGEEVVSTVIFADGIDYDTSMGGGDGSTFDPAGTPSVTFDPRGIPVNDSGGLGSGTVYLKNDQGHKYQVACSPVGSISIDPY